MKKSVHHDGHLESLAIAYTRLAHEQDRFARDGSPLRAIWIRQIKGEIKSLQELVGMPEVDCNLSDDELLAALFAA